MLPSTRERTDSTLMTSRTSVTSKGSVWPRTTVMVTSLSIGPRSISTAWSSVSPSTDSPSMWVMKSPVWMPARAAGVSSMGETTLTKPSSMVTWMPSPPNSPRVCSCMSLNWSWSM